MRIDIELDDQLLADVQRLAIDTNRTFSQAIEDSLRMALSQSSTQTGAKPIKLHTSKVGDGLQPGVDLSNNAALQDLMDEFDGVFDRYRQ